MRLHVNTHTYLKELRYVLEVGLCHFEGALRPCAERNLEQVLVAEMRSSKQELESEQKAARASEMPVGTRHTAMNFFQTGGRPRPDILNYLEYNKSLI